MVLERITQDLEVLLNNPDLDTTDREQRLLTLSEEYSLPYDQVHDQYHQIFEATLRKKIKSFLNPDLTPLKRVMQKQKVKNWLKAFITDYKDISTIIDTYASEEEDIIVSTLREALNIQKNSNRYLVEELLLRGALYLVAAAPKTGKSLLATSLGVAVVTGRKFLNRHSQSGLNVLFIQNEENISETARRAYTNGLQELELENPGLFNEITTSKRFVIAKNLDIVQDLRKIFELIDTNKVDLVIVDSLSASVNKGGLNEHSPELLAGLLAFQQNIQDRNITGVLIHHTIKSDNNDNRQEMVKGIAGRSDIVRANDGIIKMSPKGKTAVELFFLPRNGTQCQFTIEKKDGEACYWDFEVIKEESLSPENISVQNSILRLLKERYQEWFANPNRKLPVTGCFLSEITKELNLSKDIVIQRLNYMLQVEGIEVSPYKKKHLYHYPEKGESWLDQYLQEEEERKQSQQALLDLYKERKDKLLTLTNKKDIMLLMQDWSVEDKKEIQKMMTETERASFLLKLNPPKYPLGDKVCIQVDDQLTESFEITNIVYDKKSKVHLYTLDKNEGVFLESNLTQV